MIGALQRFFDNNPTSSGDAGRLNLAAAALLFEVAQTDDKLDPDERAVIQTLVTAKFGLSESEVSALVEHAEREAREAIDLHGFTRLINAHWSVAGREKLAEWMWQVVYADGRLDDHEVHLMRKIQRLLHIPHRRFIAAKLRHQPGATETDNQ